MQFLTYSSEYAKTIQKKGAQKDPFDGYGEFQKRFIALFGILAAKFFGHVEHMLKIFQQICTKMANFIKQSALRKRPI